MRSITDRSYTNSYSFFVSHWYTGVYEDKFWSQLFESCMVPSCPEWVLKHDFFAFDAKIPNNKYQITNK